MRITNPKIPMFILTFAITCGLALAIHIRYDESRATARILGKGIAGSSGMQWHCQNPLPQGNDLAGASFVDANTGTAVGFYGTIVMTTDAGNSWTIQSSGTENRRWI